MYTQRWEKRKNTVEGDKNKNNNNNTNETRINIKSIKK